METKTTKDVSQDYSLLLAVVNKGNTDLVMNAARKAGGQGGTIAVARGTGNPELAKTYGLVIQPEKELVFIVVNSSIKEKVMAQIYEEAGLETKGSGILIPCRSSMRSV
jgi:nitrogen regulatory protein PII